MVAVTLAPARPRSNVAPNEPTPLRPAEAPASTETAPASPTRTAPTAEVRDASRTVAAGAESATRSRLAAVESGIPRTLRRGSRGEDVRALQEDMVRLGYMSRDEMNTGPGTFGFRTHEAVVDFQRAHGLRPDGQVGPRTRAALQQATHRGERINEPPPAPQGEPLRPAPSENPPAAATPPSSQRPNPQGRIGQVYRDNAARADNARMDGRYQREVDQVMRNLTPEKRRQIDEIARRANLPPSLVAGIWYREASLRDGVYLHNGDPLGRPTTHVPRGISFRRDQFVEAAVHALNQKRHVADQLGLNYNSRDPAAMATYAEFYNGLGYRNHGRVSPYAFAGTDQYRGGMYVRDGVYSANTWDRRPGVLAIATAYERAFGG
ncbi:MAG: peptidoglycan-binding protein [Myxococcota bacterium]